jgi:CHAD domain-containing protein
MSSFARVLTDNAHELLSLIPTVRDARPDAIHDARVVARRLRAALDLLTRDHRSSRLVEAADLVRRVSRALGRARDVDVSLALLEELERRGTSGSHAIAVCRLELMRARTLTRRRMVKKIDAVAIERLPGLILGPALNVGRVVDVRARERAHELVALIDRASGVYFPRRAHAARIGIKRLRYLLEFSGRDSAHELKALRRAQQILGDIQDRQVLHDLVGRQRDSDSKGADESLEALLGMLEAESVALYASFLERRGDLLLLCEHLCAQSQRRGGAGALITVAAVAAGSLWQIRHRRLSDLAS